MVDLSLFLANSFGVLVWQHQASQDSLLKGGKRTKRDKRDVPNFVPVFLGPRLKAAKERLAATAQMEGRKGKKKKRNPPTLFLLRSTVDAQAAQRHVSGIIGQGFGCSAQKLEK